MHKVGFHMRMFNMTATTHKIQIRKLTKQINNEQKYLTNENITNYTDKLTCSHLAFPSTTQQHQGMNSTK